MSFLKIHIHFVWSTKNRIPFLDSLNLRLKVWKHIKENGKEKGIFVDQVNGYSDHCHCLVSLKSNQTVQNIAQLIKGESSHWINENNLCEDKFQWQDEYFAVSVSESMLERVRNYIQNQEQHHKNSAFDQELKQIKLKHNF